MESPHEVGDNGSQGSGENFELYEVASDGIGESDIGAFEDEVGEILHDCPHCPELKIDVDKFESQQLEIVQASTSLSIIELYEAAARGCKFVQRCVEPAQSLLKRAPNVIVTGTDRPPPVQVEVEEMGMKLSRADDDDLWAGIDIEFSWVVKDGSYAYPGAYHTIDTVIHF
jgi:hypothetical protein